MNSISHKLVNKFSSDIINLQRFINSIREIPIRHDQIFSICFLISISNMATYEIFPNTSVDGAEIDIDTSSVSSSMCRRLCDDTEECRGFTWDNTTEKCALYSSLTKFETIKGVDTRMKKSSPSYWMLWILAAGLLIILFVNKCRRK